MIHTSETSGNVMKHIWAHSKEGCHASNKQRISVLVWKTACLSVVLCTSMCRHLERKEKEAKEKEKEERRRRERKNRDAFKELLQRHLSEGVLVAKMRYKVRHHPSVFVVYPLCLVRGNCAPSLVGQLSVRLHAA